MRHDDNSKTTFVQRGICLTELSTAALLIGSVLASAVLWLCILAVL